MTSRLHS